MRRNLHSVAAVLAVGCVLATAQPGWAAANNWQVFNTTNLTWSTAANWSAGVYESTGNYATYVPSNFNGNFLQNTVVTVDVADACLSSSAAYLGDTTQTNSAWQSLTFSGSNTLTWNGGGTTYFNGGSVNIESGLNLVGAMSINLNLTTGSGEDATSSLSQGLRLGQAFTIGGALSGAGTMSFSSYSVNWWHGDVILASTVNTATGQLTLGSDIVVRATSLTALFGSSGGNPTRNVTFGAGNGAILEFAGTITSVTNPLSSGNAVGAFTFNMSPSAGQSDWGFAARDNNVTLNFGNAGAAINWGFTGYQTGIQAQSALILGAPDSDHTVNLVNALNLQEGVSGSYQLPDYQNRMIFTPRGVGTVPEGQISGVISDATPLTTNGSTLYKSGAGALVLSASNSYRGDTHIVAGLLLADNTQGTATGTGNIYVYAEPTVTVLAPGNNSEPTNYTLYLTGGSTTNNLQLGQCFTNIATINGASVAGYTLGGGSPTDYIRAMTTNTIVFNRALDAASSSTNYNITIAGGTGVLGGTGSVVPKAGNGVFVQGYSSANNGYASIAPGDYSTIGTLTIGSAATNTTVTLNDYSRLAIRLSSAASTSDLLNVYGNFTIASSNTMLDLIQFSGSTLTGSYTLLQTLGGGTLTGTFGTVEYGATAYSGNVIADPTGAGWTVGGKTVTLQYNTNSLVLNVVAPLTALFWTGAVNNTWDFTASNTNWNTSPAAAYQDNFALTFDDRGSANPSISLNIVATPLSVVFTNTAVNYTLSGSGSINGATGLEKDQAGTLTLATSNGYTGGTAVNGGTVIVNTNNALGSGAVTVGDASGTASASLLVGLDQITIAPNITVQSGSSGTATLGGANTSGTGIFTGTVTLQEALTLTAAGGGTVDFQGPMDNSLGQTLTKVGAGTVILSGPQTSGAGAALQVQAGTLNLNANGGANLAVSTTNAGSTLNFGANQTLNSIDVGDNTVVSMTNYTVSAGNVVVRGGAQVQGGGTSLLTVTGTLSGTGTIFGPTTLSNAAALSPGTAAGPGTLYTEDLVLGSLSQLIYRLGQPGVIGGASNDLTVVNGNLTLDGNMSIGATNFGGVGAYTLFTYSGTLTNNGVNIFALPSGLAGALDLSTANQVNLDITNAPSALTWKANVNGQWDLTTANWNVATSYTNGANVLFDDTAAITSVGLGIVVTPGSVTFNNSAQNYTLTGGGGISGTTGLVKEGSGQVTFYTANNYTGDTSILAGTLVSAYTDNLGSGASQIFLGNTTGSANATLALLGAITLDRNITVQAGSTGTLTIGGNNISYTAAYLSGLITLQTNVVLCESNGSPAYLVLTGGISNAGGATMTKVGAGTVELGGPQTQGPGAALNVLQGNVYLNANMGANLAITASNASIVTFYANQTIQSLTLCDSSLGYMNNGRQVTAGNVTVYSGARIDITAPFVYLGTQGGGLASSRLLTVSGILSGSGWIYVPVTLSNSATLSPGLGGPGTLSMFTNALYNATNGYNGGTLTLSTNTGLVYDLGQPGVIGGANNDLTVVNGDLVLAGLLTVSSNSFGGAGTYTLFDYTGNLTNNTLTVSLPSGYVGNIDLTTSDEVNLLVTALPRMVWQGTTDNNWDATTANWNNPAVAYADNNVTILDDTGTNTAINLSVVATPLSLTVSNNVLAYSISGSGSINGPTSLVKYGSATLTLATSNGYTGGTAVNGGTVIVNTNNALGSGAVTVGDASGTASASLLVGLDQITIAPNITVQSGSSGTATLGGANTSGTGIFTGTVTLQEALTLTAAGGGTVDFQGPMDNSLGQTLTKVGAGTVILSGPQTSGAGAALQVQAGTLNLNANGGANLAVSTTNAGSTLNFGANQTLNSIDVGDNTVVSMTNYTVSAGNVVVRGGAQVQGGGTSLLTVTGTLSGTGTILGPTTLSNAAALSPGTAAGPGTLYTEDLVLGSLSQLIYRLGQPGVIGGASNDLTVVNGNLTLDGNMSIGATNFGGVGAYTLFTYTGSLINNTLTVSSLPVGFFGNIDLSVANQVNLLVFTTTNLVWKGTTDNNWNFATANWNSPGVVYNNNTDTVLDDTGTNTAINLSVVVTPLSLTVSNNLVAYSISGSGSINGSTSLVKNGTNTLTLSTSNGYTGGTAINAGLVKFTQAAALPPTGTVTVGNGGTLAVNVGGTGEFSNATSGVDSLGNVINAPTWAVGSTLGVDTTNAGGSLTYTGVIAGNMGLNKLGNGTLFLTAAPTYAGATTVTAGTLQTPQIANNNSLTIASGAKVVLTTNGGLNPNASVVSSLAIAGTLDLGDNGLIVTGATSATESAVAALIASGFNGGDWQGTGITSSTVAAHSTSMTIAYDFASNIHLTFSGGFATWGGQSISSTNASTDLLVMPTLIGDANMDGYVNFVDVTEMIPNLGSTPGQTWGGGDFSGDGYVNFVDVTELIPNLGGSVSVLSPDVVVGSSSVTVTPEPASLVLLGLGGMMILGGRRRANWTSRR